MKTIIMITGPLAALKSTLAHFLAGHLNLPAFTKDRFKEVLVETIGAKDRRENRVLSVAAVAMLDVAMQAVLAVQDAVIIESNFKAEEIAQIEAFASQFNIAILSIRMRGETQALYQRYLAREDDRHVAHRSAGTMPEAIFADSVAYYDACVLPGTCLCYDTTLVSKTLFETILSDVTAYLTTQTP